MSDLRLVTIPISHFCEKARWALDRGGIPYREDPHLQGLHVLHVKRAGGRLTAPVLVTPEGALADSSDILAWVDRRTDRERRLYPEGELGEQARALESELDLGLGPDARRWMYFHTFPEREVVLRFNASGVPACERRVLPMVLPLMTPFINRRLDITPATVEASYRGVHACFDRVAERLTDGRRFMLGDRFTAADLAFAALAAAVVWPPDYGVPLPQPEDVRKQLGDEILAFRAHPAGAFALRMFREERRPRERAG